MSTSCVAGCTPPYGACTAEHTCYCYPGWAGDNCRIRTSSSCVFLLLYDQPLTVCRVCRAVCAVVRVRVSCDFKNAAVVPLGVGQTVEGSLGPNQITYYVFNASSSLASIGLLEVEPWARGYYWYASPPSHQPT
jgi:hypothetical protein